VSTIRIAAAVAAVTAGPKLYALVEAGDLSATSALVRWSAVAAACAVGVTGIRRIVADYTQQARVAALVRERAAHTERVVLEGTTVPAVRPAVRPADPTPR
jgi:succinate dehydrogenase/fumarate reductase cytochrome b subunit